MEESYKNVKKSMEEVFEEVSKELANLRVGRASPSILEGITVEYYGKRLPLNQVATISTPQPQLLTIQPWDKSIIQEIRKSILTSNLGISPIVEANLIRLPIPPLSEERRKEIIKIGHRIAEEGRVAIREERRKAKEELKRREKEKEISEDNMYQGIEKIQKLTDQFTCEIDETLRNKEKEILEG